MSIERILIAIISIFLAAIAAPIALFYLYPRYERFHGEALKDEENLFFRVLAGPMAEKAKTEKGWRISLCFMALMHFFIGCAGLYFVFLY